MLPRILLEFVGSGKKWWLGVWRNEVLLTFFAPIINHGLVGNVRWPCERTREVFGTITREILLIF